MDWERWLGSAILGVAGAGAVWLSPSKRCAAARGPENQQLGLEWKRLYGVGSLALFVAAIGAGIAISGMALGR